jgi:signal transduction histidine kinase
MRSPITGLRHRLPLTLVTLLALTVGGAMTFHLFQRQLSRAWFAFAVHPDLVRAVERSRDDQKALARLDPAGEPGYRQRFSEAQTLLARLQVLELSRRELVRRYEVALLAVVAGVVLVAGTVYAVRQGRQEGRLARLQVALADLAAGRPDVRLPDRRRDLIGRIGRMVERASRVMARDRRRLASLENLSAWQEAARRHAHEMRTPLAAARLELARVRDLAEGIDGPSRGELVRLHESLEQELDRLTAFTAGFTGFARLPQPTLVRRDLPALVAELAALFAGAWPELTLRVVPAAAPLPVLVDAEMLRQVLVNLADNAALALREAGRRGTLTLSCAALEEPGGGTALLVTDDGPGVSPELRERIFEPYVSSRRAGEGMGLGLAISRKILLDHGGDLELVGGSEADAAGGEGAARRGGAAFRLLFPPLPGAPA